MGPVAKGSRENPLDPHSGPPSLGFRLHCRNDFSRTPQEFYGDSEQFRRPMSRLYVRREVLGKDGGLWDTLWHRYWSAFGACTVVQ